MNIVETYKGVNISLNSNLRFTAFIDGKLVDAASIDGVRAKITKAHAGEATGRVEGLTTPPSFELRTGLRPGSPLIVLGISTETTGTGKNRNTRVIYLLEAPEARYGTRKGDKYVMGAGRLAHRNPLAEQKLQEIHEEYERMAKELLEKAQKIVQEEFAYFDVEDVRKMLEASQS